MQVQKTKLDGVLLITHDGFEDFRGNFDEVYNKDLYEKNGITVNFVQDNTSVTHQFVLRGIHGGSETWKLITCLEGRMYFVAVNCDTESKDFGKWEAFLLTGEDRKQLLIPPQFGSSYVVLSPQVIVHYKQSTYYDQDTKFAYKWNDPRFKIWWPVKNPILSEKDE